MIMAQMGNKRILFFSFGCSCLLPVHALQHAGHGMPRGLPLARSSAASLVDERQRGMVCACAEGPGFAVSNGIRRVEEWRATGYGILQPVR